MRIVHPPRSAPDPAVAANLHRAAGNWAANRARAESEVDWPAWRERATDARADAVAHMPELLAELTERFEQLGGTVHRAATGAQANEIVADICARNGASMAIKGKSMTTEETGLNAALTARGIEPVESDLGEWVVQLAGQRPSHILAPAVHMSAVEIAELLSRRAGRELDPEDTPGLVAYARAELREAFLTAGAGITGVNMAVAATGSLVLVESEGNLRLSTSLPRVHVAVMGIEKVVRDWAAAAHLMQMLPLASHGRFATGSMSVIGGPARDGDDGPRELHLVLLDDGRSDMADGPLADALRCIRCGACLYACPVYRQIGGHAYGAAYSGPIGAIVTPGLEDAQGTSGDLAWLSSLCGACTDACPVGIPLDEQLVTVRAMAHEREPRAAERALFTAWGRLWSRPGGYRASAATGGRALAPAWRTLARARSAGSGAGDAATEGDWLARVPFPFAGWTAGRDVRAPAAQPFHTRWRERRGRASSAPRPPIVDSTVDTTHKSTLDAPEAPVGMTVEAAHDPGQTPDLALFAARLGSYEAVLHETGSLGEARAVARELIAAATTARWDDDALDEISDSLAPAADAEFSLVVADGACAITGQFALVHGPGRPRGAGVLPPRQVVLLRRETLVQTLGEMLRALGIEDGQAPPPSVVLVTGPSRTADIEQRIVRGAHAPRDVDVVLY